QDHAAHVPLPEPEEAGEGLEADRYGLALLVFQEELSRGGGVTAEVDDARPVAKQVPLQVAGTYRPLLRERDVAPVRGVPEPVRDLAHLLAQREARVVRRVGAEEQDRRHPWRRAPCLSARVTGPRPAGARRRSAARRPWCPASRRA